MTVTVRQLAEWLHAEVGGDPELEIGGARTLHEAGPGDVSFLESDKYLPQLAASRASAVIVGRSVSVAGKVLLRVDDPLAAFVDVFRRLHTVPDTTPPGIDPSAFVHPTATVAYDARVDAFAVVGEGSEIGSRCHVHAGVKVGRFCKLAEDAILYPNVVLYDGCVLGKRVIVHANAVLGADGFGYRTVNGQHVKVPQLGHVEIEDDVEIGACSTVDRGTFQATRVGEGTKIDNHVMIAHNCRIGRRNVIVSQVGIAGSCVTGDHVVMAGQAGIAGHLHIGDRAILGAKCGVTKDVPVGGRMLGTPATPDREQMRIMMTLEKLPELRRDVKQLKRQLGLDEMREAS